RLAGGRRSRRRRRRRPGHRRGGRAVVAVLRRRGARRRAPPDEGAGGLRAEQARARLVLLPALPDGRRPRARRPGPQEDPGPAGRPHPPPGGPRDGGRPRMSDPVGRLRAWMEQARAAGLRMPEAATLSTVAGDGGPSARTVSVKRVGDAGLVFGTSLTGRKS